MPGLNLLLALLATCLHAALILSLAPALTGLGATGLARLLGHPGPPLTQPYRDLAKLIRKSSLTPDTATQLYPLWPFAALAATATAALLVPGFCTHMATAPLADFITVIFLLACAGAAEILAALETGSSLAAATAGRLALSNLAAEPALLLAILALSLITHATNLDIIATTLQAGHASLLPLGLAAAAMFAVARNQTTPPNPSPHFEYSGRHLALWRYTAMLRLTVWLTLIVTLLIPFGLATAANPLGWPAGILFWALKLILAAAILAVIDAATAAPSLLRVPQRLAAAALLGLLACLLIAIADHGA